MNDNKKFQEYTKTYYEMLDSCPTDQESKTNIAGNVFGIVAMDTICEGHNQSLGMARQVCLDFVNAWFDQAENHVDRKEGKTVH